MADTTPIDYTSRDYASLRQAMLDDAASKMPEWTSRSANDFGIRFVEALAYLGDVLSYYIDRVAGEAFLATATQRASLLNLAAMYSYTPGNGTPSTVTLTIGVAPGTGTVTIPAGTQFSSASSQPDIVPTVIFETDVNLTVTRNATLVATDVVTATQGRTVANEAIGTSTGVADQMFPLSQLSVVGTPQVWVDEGSGPVEWVALDHLIDAAGVDQVFDTVLDAAGRISIRFGDNVNGRIPANGAVLTSTYRVGAGELGNVGAGSINTLVSAPLNVVSVVNLAAATGGSDPETNDQIRRNAPKAFSAARRAVTLDDYAALALNVMGVVKSSAVGTTYAGIDLYVAPAGGGLPSNSLKTSVGNYISARQMVGSVVTVHDPAYTAIDIAVSIQVLDQYKQVTVKNAVQNALANYLAFVNTDFGQRIPVAAIYSLVMRVPGVSYATITVLATHAVGTGVADVVLPANQIPTAAGGTLAVTVTGGGIP